MKNFTFIVCMIALFSVAFSGKSFESSDNLLAKVTIEEGPVSFWFLNCQETLW